MLLGSANASRTENPVIGLSEPSSLRHRPMRKRICRFYWFLNLNCGVFVIFKLATTAIFFGHQCTLCPRYRRCGFCCCYYWWRWRHYISAVVQLSWARSKLTDACELWNDQETRLCYDCHIYLHWLQSYCCKVRTTKLTPIFFVSSLSPSSELGFKRMCNRKWRQYWTKWQCQKRSRNRQQTRNENQL